MLMRFFLYEWLLSFISDNGRFFLMFALKEDSFLLSDVIFSRQIRTERNLKDDSGLKNTFGGGELSVSVSYAGGLSDWPGTRSTS